MGHGALRLLRPRGLCPPCEGRADAVASAALSFAQSGPYFPALLGALCAVATEVSWGHGCPRALLGVLEEPHEKVWPLLACRWDPARFAVKAFGFQRCRVLILWLWLWWRGCLAHILSCVCPFALPCGKGENPNPPQKRAVAQARRCCPGPKASWSLNRSIAGATALGRVCSTCVL